MIFAYSFKNKFKPVEITAANVAELKDTLWMDLLSPTSEEESIIEKFLSIDIPTREEMGEIELSSRLYKHDNAIFMTATMLANVETTRPKFDAVSFVLVDHKLVTVRYIEPKAFKAFSFQLQKSAYDYPNAPTLLIDLLDASIDRLADILEMVAHDLEDFSVSIFRPAHTDGSPRVDYRKVMQRIGVNGDITTKVQESLMTFNRLVVFLGQKNNLQIDAENQQQLQVLAKDVESLRDHGTFLSTKVNYLLDATLGMVNIEQNQIIKIFSVAAVIFLPPTLIASIYGMNFKIMPELGWAHGYHYALFLMLLSAFLPYIYFKWRKWL
jgi:magnesium transporter